MNKRILFIISAAHSSSTLLDMLLGTHLDIFSIGEIVNYLRAVKNNLEPCVCGKIVNKCNFWKPIINQINKRSDYYQNIGNGNQLPRGKPRSM